MELKHYYRNTSCGQLVLLIVPYGIETFHGANVVRLVEAFNRTLWD